MKVDTEQLLANAARFLYETKNEAAAALIASCSSCAVEAMKNWGHFDAYITLACPRTVYDLLQDENNPVRKAVEKAFSSVLPPDLEFGTIIPRIELSPVDSDWRAQLLDKIAGCSIGNQGTELSDDRPVKLWKDLRFRSVSEIRIAEALERARVLFLPNCMARLGDTTRETREADFLVCLDGRWGILEVDGEPFHPPSRTVQDHQRDRLFRADGILVVEHFDAAECFERADAVVKKFLAILRQA